MLMFSRADLTLAVQMDVPPVFFSTVSWEPYIAKIYDANRHGFPITITLDMKLGNLWADMKEFTRSANLAFQTRQKMDPVLFQEVLISVVYRLLLLDPSQDSLPTSLHLGLLALTANVFLRTSQQLVHFEKIFTRLRTSIKSQTLRHPDVLQFKLWLLFIAHFEGKGNIELDTETRETLGALRITSWDETREVLKQYLWIGALHDDGVKKAFYRSITATSTPPSNKIK